MSVSGRRPTGEPPTARFEGAVRSLNRRPRGAFVPGLVAGLLLGLALALGVALYITKAPIPFINKVPQRTAVQDNAEAERNRNWDPNAGLGGKSLPRPAAPASPAASTPPAATSAASAVAAPVASAASRPAAGRDPASILSGGPFAAPAGEASIFFVQAGAYTRNEDAEQQRAKLALLGQSAKVTEREQAGRVVYRVRLGPFVTRDEADALKTRLQDSAIETQIVRVEKP